jgi:hypothetical protein
VSRHQFPWISLFIARRLEQIYDRIAICLEELRAQRMTSYEDSVTGHAYSTLLRLGLPAYTMHFKSPTYMRESMLERLDRTVCKDILKASAQQPEVRFVA